MVLNKKLSFFDFLRSALYGLLKVNGWMLLFKEKEWKHSLMDSILLTVDNTDHIDEFQINGVGFDYNYPKFLIRLDEFVLNVERCNNVNEFLILTKLDFEQEQYLKRRLFGKELENMDCLMLTRNYLCSVTLGHTFNDNFLFVDLNLDYIPCSSMHSEGRRVINKVIPPCKLVKMRHIMMLFIHNEVIN